MTDIEVLHEQIKTAAAHLPARCRGQATLFLASEAEVREMAMVAQRGVIEQPLDDGAKMLYSTEVRFASLVVTLMCAVSALPAITADMNPCKGALDAPEEV